MLVFPGATSHFYNIVQQKGLNKNDRIEVKESHQMRLKKKTFARGFLKYKYLVWGGK
jgi:hypothetical protein